MIRAIKTLIRKTPSDPAVDLEKKSSGTRASKKKITRTCPGRGLYGLKGSYWLHQHVQRWPVALLTCPFFGWPRMIPVMLSISQLKHG